LRRSPAARGSRDLDLQRAAPDLAELAKIQAEPAEEGPLGVPEQRESDLIAQALARAQARPKKWS
jgi:hypothetical protein